MDSSHRATSSFHWHFGLRLSLRRPFAPREWVPAVGRSTAKPSSMTPRAFGKYCSNATNAVGTIPVLAALLPSIRLIANARNNPQMDPAAASNKLSESSSRTIRQRVAPSARRMVICRSRALARASIKFARLAQAMSKTKPEIPRSNHRDVSESERNSENPVLAGNAPSLYSRYFFVPSAS